MSRRHMAKEREILAKLQMLEQEARQKYDELDVIFQQIVETKAKIEEQRQKQLIQIGDVDDLEEAYREGIEQ